MNTRLLKFVFLFIQTLIPLPGIAFTNISTDQSALLALKSTFTLDPSHILSTNWSVSTSVCSWIGVTCGSRHQRVTALDISSMGLAGNLPPETGNLSFIMSFNLSGNNFSDNLPEEMSRLRRLQVIDFSVNNFTGDLPSWFQNMAELKFLDLRNNSFSGPLPNTFANISKLEKLDLSFNSVHGEIPRGIVNAYSLKELVLRDNRLSGTIPVEVFNISNLEILSLSGNSFSGGLPVDMCHGIPWIERLSLSFNQLGGQIPSTISQCSRLRILSLAYNRFTGPIPREIGNLSAMEILFLKLNNIAGGIPHELGNLLNLKVLSIGSNLFSGSIPGSIFNLTSLQHIDIENCTLDGPIPSEMCSLGSQLESVQFGDNKIVGQLPEKIGQCSRLQILALYDNNITGSIPNSMWNLTMLTGLYAGSNNFIGRIPECISNASSLAILDLSSNSFSGPIPGSFGKLRFLRRLHLNGNYFISESRELTIISSLTNCTNLKIFSLGQSPTLNITLPVTIGNLSSSLQYLYIAQMDLFGNIPNEICNLRNLMTLNLNGNHLTGPIPHNLTNLRKLQGFDLSQNKLSGMLPNSICELRNLYILYLSSNQIEGSIPDCIGEITTLRNLYIDGNRLSSSIPMNLWKLRDFLELDFSSNYLTGSLPLDIGNMKSLIQLNLSMNRFSSNIPNSIGNLQNLQYLSLAYNRFTGFIPESLGNMLSLENLNLSHNNLSGNIPNSLQSLQGLSYCDVSFNELSGHIPSNGSFRDFTSHFFVSNDGLCGEMRYGVPQCRIFNTGGSKKRKVIIAVVCALGVTLLASALALTFIVARYRAKDIRVVQTSVQIKTTPIRVSYYDIVNSTEGFRESHLIGVGGFSSVYKGTLRDGKLVAIKVLDLKVEGAFTKFDTECELLNSLRHRNLCKIFGVCSNDSFKALVLEYLPNGSFEKWLYSEGCFLDVMQRVSIMVDVACALEYLHHGYSVPVVHRDLKPSNVLLDENMVARLSDFGISKVLNEGDSFVQSETLATFGYMSPEYGSEGLVSVSSDVYSYGIMLMEVFTRFRPNSETFMGDLSLKGLVHDSWPTEIMRVIDLRLFSHGDELFAEKLECLSSIMGLALECSSDNPNERISMKDVVVQLRKVQMKLFAYSQENKMKHAAK